MNIFEKKELYSRKDIRRLLGFENPNNIGGTWSTGYVQYDEEFYIFSTISEAGRTGHNYDNKLDHGILHWYTKNNHSFNVPSIQKMVSGDYLVHIFTRTDSSNPKFTYQGVGFMESYKEGKPAQNNWRIV